MMEQQLVVPQAQSVFIEESAMLMILVDVKVILICIAVEVQLLRKTVNMVV